MKNIITYKSFNSFKKIAHFCTTRHGGVSVGNFDSFNLSPYSGDNLTNVERNIKLLSKTVCFKQSNLVIPFQNHGCEIKIIDEEYLQLTDIEKKAFINGVDALITNTPDICIAVSTADCVPITIYDSSKQVIAVVHAGWRGTCGRLIEKTINKLQQHFNCQVEDLHVVIGPSISAKNYMVGEELIQFFTEAGFPTQLIFKQQNNQIFLDLWASNKWLIETLGVPENNIEICGICTFDEHEHFFSARRLGIKSGRILSGIMLKK